MRATVNGALASAESLDPWHAVVDMNQAVDQSLRALEAAAKQTAAIVSVDPLPQVHGDETELVRLMQNLIGNALKFTACSPRPRIWLTATSTDGVSTFSVRDTGTALTRERAAEIHGRFKPGTRPDRRRATGFGLRIAHQIVEDHGGSIWIRRSPRGGMVVSFTLCSAASVAASQLPQSRGLAS